jgi:hypothetical protein
MKRMSVIGDDLSAQTSPLAVHVSPLRFATSERMCRS